MLVAVMSRLLMAENHSVKKMNLHPTKTAERFLVRNAFETQRY